LFYLLVGCVPLTWLLLHKTGWGLRLRAAGNSPEALHAAGVSVAATRLTAILWAGALSGLAGAYLLLAEAGVFTEGMSGGRGFTAIAAVVFGGWRVAGVLGASFLFGLAEALQFQLPAMGINLPNPFLLGLPYLVALVAVAVLPQRGSSPVKLMIPFDAKAA
jgi:simple sugar transport system permease protein